MRYVATVRYAKYSTLKPPTERSAESCAPSRRAHTTSAEGSVNSSADGASDDCWATPAPHTAMTTEATRSSSKGVPGATISGSTAHDRPSPNTLARSHSSQRLALRVRAMSRRAASHTPMRPACAASSTASQASRRSALAWSRRIQATTAAGITLPASPTGMVRSSARAWSDEVSTSSLGAPAWLWLAASGSGPFMGCIAGPGARRSQGTAPQLIARI